MINNKFAFNIITIAIFLSQIIACTSTTANKKIAGESWHSAHQRVIKKYAPTAHSNLQRDFQRSSVAYPPNKIALLAFKQEGNLELWAKGKQQNWQYIKTYPLTALSGKAGPKLREWDKQIPEGIYSIAHLNPQSSYHLSMKVNYPNQWDRFYAKQDKRKKLGDHIFIHGKQSSAGCLAVGDKAMNQLYTLVSTIGKHNTKIIIAPNDMRKKHPVTAFNQQPIWVPELYQRIKQELRSFIS